MDLHTKIFIVILILLLDLIAFIVPVTAIIIIVIIIAKPNWFKEFVDELYESKDKIE